MPWMFGGTAALFGLIALFAAWYTVGVSTFGIRASVDFSLWGGCSAGSMGMGVPCGAIGTPGPFNTTGAMLPSLVFAVIAFLLYLGMTVMGYARKMSPRAAGYLAVIAAVCSFIAPLALAGSMGPVLAGEDFGPGFGTGPMSPDGSFWGSVTQNNGGMFPMPTTVDWGPGGGWFMSLLAAVFGLIAGMSAVLGKPGDVPIRPPVQYYQPVMFAPMMYGPPPPYGYPPGYPPAPYGYPGPYGIPMGAPPPPVYAPPQAPAQTPAVICPRCGRANLPGAGMCASCFSALGP